MIASLVQELRAARRLEPEAELAGRELGQIEHVVDELVHALDARLTASSFF